MRRRGLGLISYGNKESRTEWKFVSKFPPIYLNEVKMFHHGLKYMKIYQANGLAMLCFNGVKF